MDLTEKCTLELQESVFVVSYDMLVEMSKAASDVSNPRAIGGCCQDCACEDRTCN